VADGLLVHGFTTQSYLGQVTLPTLAAGLAKVGRRRQDFQVKYSPFVVTGSDEKELAEAAVEVKERIAFYASTPSYRPVLEHHGWGDLQTELNLLARRGEWQAMGGLIDDEVLAAFAVVAPRPELPATLGRWMRGLADRTTWSSPPGTSPEEATEVLTTLRVAAGPEPA
jgi:probable F420-dependent oxidoreductase